MLSPNSAARDPKAQSRWYLCGVGAWFASFGLQSVIATYLITTVLHAPPSMIGIAQGMMNLPAVFLLLVGGAVADHLDNRSVMIVLHSLAAIPALLLAATVSFGWLSYEWVIAYGLGMGTITAFMMPAREAMLGRVIVHDGDGAVQRAVTNTLGIQFISQMIGMVVTTFARAVGVAPLLVLQAGVQLFGAFAVSNLAPAPGRDPAEKHSLRVHATRIADGIREVAQSSTLLPITIITFSIGILLIGSFMVIMPVIMREEYGGTVVQFALMSLAFWSGSIIASLSIARLGNIDARGRLVTLAIAIGGGALMLFAIPTTLPVFYGLVFAWGTGAGIMISMARTIVQENAPPAHLARVMSVYQLGFTGGMPIGAFILGFVVHALGARAAALVPGAAMILVLALLLATTDLWRIRSPERPATPKLAPAD
jgi:MFS family permease